MRSGHRVPRAAFLLAVLALAPAACGGTDAPAAGPAAAPEVPRAAPEGPRIGVAGSACEMPVSFAVAESYRPKAVAVAADDPLAELARRGPLTMVCELDAKPAGQLGFLRVWTGDAQELRPALTAFIGERALEPVFTDLTLGGRPALEVVYRQRDQLDEATIDPERVFAVRTGQGVAAVSLDSFDSDEHTAIRPAYELAKSTLQAAG